MQRRRPVTFGRQEGGKDGSAVPARARVGAAEGEGATCPTFAFSQIPMSYAQESAQGESE